MTSTATLFRHKSLERAIVLVGMTRLAEEGIELEYWVGLSPLFMAVGAGHSRVSAAKGEPRLSVPCDRIERRPKCLLSMAQAAVASLLAGYLPLMVVGMAVDATAGGEEKALSKGRLLPCGLMTFVTLDGNMSSRQLVICHIVIKGN